MNKIWLIVLILILSTFSMGCVERSYSRVENEITVYSYEYDYSGNLINMETETTYESDVYASDWASMWKGEQVSKGELNSVLSTMLPDEIKYEIMELRTTVSSDRMIYTQAKIKVYEQDSYVIVKMIMTSTRY